MIEFTDTKIGSMTCCNEVLGHSRMLQIPSIRVTIIDTFWKDLMRVAEKDNA